MRLRRGEEVLRSEYAVLESGVHPEASRGPGVLYLTNHRLAFEEASRLGGRGSSSVPVNVGLDRIHDVELVSRRLRTDRLRVVIHGGRPVFDVLDAASWRDAIDAARTASASPGPSSPTSAIADAHAGKILCRYCGTRSSALNDRCPYCGAPL